MKLYDSKGQLIKTGRLLGRGARGDVYALEGYSNLAAKLYRETLSARTIERLQAMVRIGNHRLLKAAAWPLDTIIDSAGEKIVGFLMPNFSGYKPIHQVFGVKSRLLHYPTATWPFLIHVATNAARSFSLIHESGHIIGDVSSTNVMVSPNALVALIDCDNYQVITENRQFLCEGGTTGYVPSEIIGADFSIQVRTKDHDSFGLAVLIFQLLFLGRHPFSGTFRGGGEKDLDLFVKERRFAYGDGAEVRQMAPPPGTLRLESVPKEIADLFERAFLTNSRPKSEEWIEALERLAKSLKRCEYHNGHYFMNSLPACPWCLLERVSGVRLFNYIFSDNSQTKLNFNLEEVWTRVDAVRSPGPPPEIPEKPEKKLRPSAEANGLYKKIRLIGFLLSITAVILTFVAWSNPFLQTLEVRLGATAGALLLLVLTGKLLEMRNQKALIDSVNPVILGLQEKKKEAERTASHFEQRWLDEASQAKFELKLEELKEKKAEYISLPALHQRKLNDLQKMSRERQLHRFLDSYRIPDAKLEEIGPEKKITLQAYGFETAADIKRDSLLRVPGFGGTLSYRLVSWRQTLEQKFVFNPEQSVTPADKYAVDQEIHSLRLKLEQELLNGPTHLRQIAGEIEAARASVQEKFVAARQSLFQADQDLSAVSMRHYGRWVLASGVLTLLLILLYHNWAHNFLNPLTINAVSAPLASPAHALKNVDPPAPPDALRVKK
jgi:DNA-binding helix-hairpin-helix protein with protein kinase domain